MLTELEVVRPYDFLNEGFFFLESGLQTTPSNFVLANEVRRGV